MDDSQHEARIERLESLLMRLFGGGGGGGDLPLAGDVTGPETATVLTQILALAGGGTQLVGVDNAGLVIAVPLGFGGPIAANEAAASALPAASTPDGTQVFILSHRSIWTSAPTSAIALVAHEVINRTGGGRLIRTEYSDPMWREEITDVYIDELNITGVANDQNRGIFNTPQVGNARQPLLTSLEFQRRWGRRNHVSGDVVGQVTIHYISGAGLAGAPNELELDFVAANDTFVQMQGENPTTVLGPIALTAFTPQNPAVPAPGGTPASIQIGATVWTPFLGKRIRRVSDGSVATVLKNIGGGVARISQPQLSGFLIFSPNPTNVNWAPGDLVVVEDLTPVLCASHWHLSGEGLLSFQFSNSITIIDLHFPVRDFQSWAPIVESSTFTEFYQCTFDQNLSLQPPWFFSACTHRGVLGGTQLDGKGGWFGGAIHIPGAGGSIGVLLSGQPNDLFGLGQLDFSTYVQNTQVIARSTAVLGSFSVWDTIAQGTSNPGGHAVLIGGAGLSSVTAIGSAAITGTVPIFGSGAPGKGMRIGAGSRAKYRTAPNVTGATGDLQLADSVAGWWFGAGIYNPIGAGIALTWANLAAPQPAGFGLSAHEPQQDAHIVKVAAT